MSTISTKDMRNAISTIYVSPKWKRDVENMPDHQVVAIYYRFLNSGKFNEKPKKPKFSKAGQRRKLGVYDDAANYETEQLKMF